MMGGSHVLFGAASWLVVASHAGLPVSHVAAGLPAAMAFSTLPDADNSRFARKVDKRAPDELLGHGGPLRHRGITHWWGWPAVVAVGLYVLGWPLPPNNFAESFVWASLVGFTSHLVGDFIFGEQPPGVPVFPWWGHVGLRFDAGGWVERLTVPVVALVALWWAVDMPGLGHVGLA